MIYLFLANGFEETEAICPLDLLRRAGLPVTTVGIGGDSVRGAHGITVSADLPEALFRDGSPEAVILPGGMPGATHLDESRTVDTALKACARRGGLLAAICAAPMVLGKRGYLAGRRAVCYPGFEPMLEGATVVNEKVVRDGNILTAVGMGAALDFGLALVTYFCGEEKAEEVRESILADRKAAPADFSSTDEKPRS